jgi:ribose-phosphate pyrophosphokinase
VDLKVFSGNSNPKLAEKICHFLRTGMGKALVKRFSDGETWVELMENVRGKDCFVVQSLSNPANEHLVELLIMIDALKRASADRITAVIPYYGYARQDRKVAPRTPISAKLVADLLEAAGTDRVLSMDLHAGQIQGFFNIPFDHLYASAVTLEWIKKKEKKGLVIVSPDAGGVERARAHAKRLGAGLAIIDKRREQANVSEVMNVIGDVKGKEVVILDDLIDTAGTLTQAVPVLIERGATKVYACATHAVLSGPALDRINKSQLEELAVTDTIPVRPEIANSRKISVLTIAPLLGEAIRRIHNEDSVSSLFV